MSSCEYPDCTADEVSEVMDYSVSPADSAQLCAEHAGLQFEAVAR